MALFCNLVSLDQWTEDRSQQIHSANPYSVRNGLQELFAATQVRQVWTLFSPIPTHWNWSFEFSAVVATGNRTDAATAMPFVTASDDGRIRIKHVYWVRYLYRSAEFSESDWTAFGAYICRKVTQAGQPAAAIEVAVGRTPVPYPSQGAAISVRRRLPCTPAAA